MRKTMSTIGLIFLSIFILIGCEEIAISEFNVVNHTIELNIGESALIQVQVSPENATQSLIFESENDDIATVDQAGNVFAITEGETVITVSASNLAHTETVTVIVSAHQNDDETSSLEIEESFLELYISENYQLNISVEPAMAINTLSMSDYDDHILSVDNEGTILALDYGVTAIKISLSDEIYAYVTVEIVSLKSETVNHAINQLPLLEHLAYADKDDIGAVALLLEQLSSHQLERLIHLEQFILLEEEMGFILAAHHVSTLIDALPNEDNLSLVDEHHVTEARDAYENLAEAEKERVNNIDYLKNAENKLQELKALTYSKMSLMTFSDPGPEHRNTSWLTDFNNELRWSSVYGDRTINGQSFEPLKYYSTAHGDLDTNPRFMEFDISLYEFDYVEGIVGASDEVWYNTDFPPQFRIYLDGDLVLEVLLEHEEDPIRYLINLRDATSIRFEIGATVSDENGRNNRPVIVEPVFLTANCEPEVTVTSSLLRQGTPDETTLYKFETHKEGPTVFIVGGIHGSERAGWVAGLEMLNYDYTKGTIYVLPVAYVRAANQVVRYVSGESDLNRAFPGNVNGTSVEQLAYAIFQAIIDANPDYVFDLHESVAARVDAGLGDTVIMNNVPFRGFLDQVIQTFNQRYSPPNPFQRLTASTSGLINVEVTEALSIPVFTIETTRGGSYGSESIPLEFRVQQQLDLLDVFMEFIYG